MLTRGTGSKRKNCRGV